MSAATSMEELLNDPKVIDATQNNSVDSIKRGEYIPPVCSVFKSSFTQLRQTDQFIFDVHQEAKKLLPNIIDQKVHIVTGEEDLDGTAKQKYQKPRKIGIVFSGGPAPGGHNVIAGIFDAAKKANPDNRIYGFLLGPDGIIENETVEITPEIVNQYRNRGGFTMIKTGRTKIDDQKKMALSLQTCKSLGLDALVIVGGDDSNTNAAFLAQEMFTEGVQVIGVPKTIDGDIQVRDANGVVLCAMSFGFHSAARAFADEISNLCTDASSDVKYWHICKVMGRVASHLALEVALQTHANMTLIGEDLANYVDIHRIQKAEQNKTVDYTAFGMTLRHLSRVVCDAIVRRAAVGKNYGILVIPEGILEFINEIQVFIIKLNTIIADYNRKHDTGFHDAFPTLDEKLDYLRRLARRSREEGGFSVWNTRDDDLFNVIPGFFQEGLLLERDSHGNFQFSQVQTEEVLLGLVKDYLNTLTEQGIYKIGIDRSYYSKTMDIGNISAEYFGPILFENYETEDRFLKVRPNIISEKTLKQHLVAEGAIRDHEDVPGPVKKIYKKSTPKFKTQTHFYGYDGRGSEPTHFDCTYTYNLGLTVFGLIANGATGQMAAIKNLEHDFKEWQPIGIPIAPLMHLEERKGRLSLVLERTIVDIDSPAFQVVKALREKWLAADTGDDHYRKPGPIEFSENDEEKRPIMLTLNSLKK